MAFILPAFAAIGSALGGAGGIAGTIGSIASVGGAVLGAVGAVQQGNAKAAAARYNAQVKQQQAAQVMDQASVRASNESVKTRQRVAAARAGSIQNGFENSGSVVDILSTVEQQGTLEGLTAMYEGGVRAQALRSGAALDEASASNARTAGYIGAGTSILSGVSRAYTGGRNLS